MRQKYKKWTDDEVEELSSIYGLYDTEKVKATLGLTSSQLAYAVKTYELGYQRDFNDLLNYSQVSYILGGIGHYTFKRFIKLGLPVTYKTFGQLSKRKLPYVRLEAFVKWLKNNPQYWSAIKVERLALGSEPDWLIAKRKRERKIINEGLNLKPGFYESYGEIDRPNRLRELRKKCGLFLSEVGYFVGTTSATVSRHERGQTIPTEMALKYRELYQEDIYG